MSATMPPPVIVDALADVNRAMLDIDRKIDGLTGALLIVGGLLVGLYVIRGRRA